MVLASRNKDAASDGNRSRRVAIVGRLEFVLPKLVPVFRVESTDAGTGEFIVEPVSVKANAEQLRGPGPIGAATAATTTTNADYQNVVAAYARALLASLDASS